jgi:hypothetical protein
MNIRADELIELIVMYFAQSLLFRIGYQALMALSFAPPYDTYDLRKLLRDQLQLKSREAKRLRHRPVPC